MTENLKGTIYIRDNELCRLKNIFKLGIASSIKNRNDAYNTYEHERGVFLLIIKIPLDKMKLIDRCLKSYLKPYNNYVGGGTEYYDRQIIDFIEPFLQKTNIEYSVLSQNEINVIERTQRINKIKEKNKNICNIFNNINIYNLKRHKDAKDKENSKVICPAVYSPIFSTIIHREPNNQQNEILRIIPNFYAENNIGKLIWACGLGKTLLSVFMVKTLKCKTVLFGVPSNYLQNQIKDEIIKIFPDKLNILFVGGNNTNKEIQQTTDKNSIIHFMGKQNEPVFIVTTYHSCYLLIDNEISFDFKIGDEAHHLVGVEEYDEEKGFRLFHKIKSTKTLFMTATEKIIDTNSQNYEKNVWSMEDEIVFGKLIDKKTVHWAIENKKITDYNILVLKNTEDEVDEIISSLGVIVNNKELFISAFMSLKSFEKHSDLTHILLYTNTTADAELSKYYIDLILDLNVLFIFKENVYNKSLHSKYTGGNLKEEVEKFKNSERGIISCVYIFGEGFNLPKLNGVCISGNMQSETRIIQYLLRPNRLEKENPNKKAYVIIPFIDTDDEWKWPSTENSTAYKSFEKVRLIISRMRNVDNSIEQKIFVCVGKINTNNNKTTKFNEINDNNNSICLDYELEENSIELNKIKLKLRYSKDLGSKFTEEQDEYNYMCFINKLLNICSKKEYFKIREQDCHNYVITTNPEEYFISKGVWKNWYDFLGVDLNKFIQSKEEWINFCKNKNISTLVEYEKACEIYENLPVEPEYVYKNFTNIISELGNYKNRRK